MNVLTRYRELGSTLEASVQVREEFEEKGNLHWHRIYERCWCGYLTVPASCYEYDDKGRQTNTQEDAEKVYLENRTESRTETPRTESNKRTGRPKKWASEADRLKAYRSRNAN